MHILIALVISQIGENLNNLYALHENHTKGMTCTINWILWIRRWLALHHNIFHPEPIDQTKKHNSHETNLQSNIPQGATKRMTTYIIGSVVTPDINPETVRTWTTSPVANRSKATTRW